MKIILSLLSLILLQTNNLCLNNTLSKTNLCVKHLGLSRREMPQIEGNNKEIFLDYLYHNKDIKSWCELKNPKLVTSTQNEIHGILVSKLLVTLKIEGQKDPIFISTDGHVLDGHHRWVALEVLDMEMKAIIIDLPIEKLLYLSYNFSKTGYE